MLRQILADIMVGLTILGLLILPGLFSSTSVSADTCYEYYDGSGAGYSMSCIGNGDKRVQTFTAASDHPVNKVSLYVDNQYGTVSLTVSILKCNTAYSYAGTVLSTVTVSVPARGADWLTIDIPTCNLLNGQSYAILAEGPTTCVAWRSIDTGDTWGSAGSPGYSYKYTMGDWYSDPGFTFNFRLCHDLALPSVTTSAADPIGGTSATLNGDVTNTGGENCDEQGFIYYPTTSHPTNPGNVSPGSIAYASITFDTGSFGTGEYSRTSETLSSCTTYYFRAYAHNSQGYVYGDELNFITNCRPSVTTNDADPIGNTSATLHGNITNTGGENCDEQGFIYYPTTSHPTNPGNVSPSSLIYALRAFNTGSFGTGAFSYPISLLSSCTTYYFRAYAHNSQGWVYGDELLFITLAGPLPVASFSATPTTGCAPLTVNFTGNATNGTTWSWAFGDSNTSTFQSPTHQYITAGIYTVTLTATNSCGSSSVTKAAYIIVEDCHEGPLGIGNGFSQPPTSHGTGIGIGANPSPVGLPNLSVQSASLSAKTVTPGTPITVTADIANKSAVNGNKKVTLYVNGQVETTQGVTVNSGGSTQLTFNVSRSEPGDYSVYVDGVPAGSFNVELFRESNGLLLFSAILVGLAFLIGIVMLWRRQQRPG